MSVLDAWAHAYSNIQDTLGKLLNNNVSFVSSEPAEASIVITDFKNIFLEQGSLERVALFDSTIRRYSEELPNQVNRRFSDQNDFDDDANELLKFAANEIRSFIAKHEKASVVIFTNDSESLPGVIKRRIRAEFVLRFPEFQDYFYLLCHAKFISAIRNRLAADEIRMRLPPQTTVVLHYSAGVADYVQTLRRKEAGTPITVEKHLAYSLMSEYAMYYGIDRTVAVYAWDTDVFGGLLHAALCYPNPLIALFLTGKTTGYRIERLLASLQQDLAWKLKMDSNDTVGSFLTILASGGHYFSLNTDVDAVEATLKNWLESARPLVSTSTRRVGKLLRVAFQPKFDELSIQRPRRKVEYPNDLLRELVETYYRSHTTVFDAFRFVQVIMSVLISVRNLAETIDRKDLSLFLGKDKIGDLTEWAEHLYSTSKSPFVEDFRKNMKDQKLSDADIETRTTELLAALKPFVVAIGVITYAGPFDKLMKSENRQLLPLFRRMAELSLGEATKFLTDLTRDNGNQRDPLLWWAKNGSSIQLSNPIMQNQAILATHYTWSHMNFGVIAELSPIYQASHLRETDSMSNQSIQLYVASALRD